MELTAVWKALADDNRLLILRLLNRRAYCVRALSRQLGISQAAVSQHLKVLREAGLVSAGKRGYFTHYRVESAPLRAAAQALEQLACGEPVPCGGCGQGGNPACRGASSPAPDQ